MQQALQRNVNLFQKVASRKRSKLARITHHNFIRRMESAVFDQKPTEEIEAIKSKKQKTLEARLHCRLRRRSPLFLRQRLRTLRAPSPRSSHTNPAGGFLKEDHALILGLEKKAKKARAEAEKKEKARQEEAQKAAEIDEWDEGEEEEQLESDDE